MDSLKECMFECVCVVCCALVNETILHEDMTATFRRDKLTMNCFAHDKDYLYLLVLIIMR